MDFLGRMDVMWILGRLENVCKRPNAPNAQTAPSAFQGVSKGRAVERILGSTAEARGTTDDFILCIGDDRWVWNV